MESDKTKMCDLQNIVNNSVRTQASEEIKLEDLIGERSVSSPPRLFQDSSNCLSHKCFLRCGQSCLR